MSPLLHRLTERKPENLDYLGVSYGLTPQLLRSVKNGTIILSFKNKVTDVPSLTGSGSVQAIFHYIYVKHRVSLQGSTRVSW